MRSPGRWPRRGSESGQPIQSPGGGRGHGVDKPRRAGPAGSQESEVHAHGCGQRLGMCPRCPLEASKQNIPNRVRDRSVLDLVQVPPRTNGRAANMSMDRLVAEAAMPSKPVYGIGCSVGPCAILGARCGTGQDALGSGATESQPLRTGKRNDSPAMRLRGRSKPRRDTTQSCSRSGRRNPGIDRRRYAVDRCSPHQNMPAGTPVAGINEVASQSRPTSRDEIVEQTTPLSSSPGCANTPIGAPGLRTSTERTGHESAQYAVARILRRSPAFPDSGNRDGGSGVVVDRSSRSQCLPGSAMTRKCRDGNPASGGGGPACGQTLPLQMVQKRFQALLGRSSRASRPTWHSVADDICALSDTLDR